MAAEAPVASGWASAAPGPPGRSKPGTAAGERAPAGEGAWAVGPGPAGPGPVAGALAGPAEAGGRGASLTQRPTEVPQVLGHDRDNQ